MDAIVSERRLPCEHPVDGRMCQNPYPQLRDEYGMVLCTLHYRERMRKSRRLVSEQREPRWSGGPAVWHLVAEDMTMRNIGGIEKYGTPLRPFNGRDALIDAYQEALDLVVYLRQAIYERDGR